MLVLIGSDHIQRQLSYLTRLGRSADAAPQRRLLMTDASTLKHHGSTASSIQQTTQITGRGSCFHSCYVFYAPVIAHVSIATTSVFRTTTKKFSLKYENPWGINLSTMAANMNISVLRSHLPSRNDGLIIVFFLYLAKLKFARRFLGANIPLQGTTYFLRDGIIVSCWRQRHCRLLAGC